MPLRIAATLSGRFAALVVRRLQQVPCDEQRLGMLARCGIDALHQLQMRVDRCGLERNRMRHRLLLPIPCL
jgi:hypothetical protein